VVAFLTLVAVGPGRMVFADIATVFGFVQIYRDGTLSYYLGQAWSLDTEVQFYLLLGVVLVLARVVIRRPPTWTIVVAVLGAAFLVSAWLRELTPADGPWALSLPAMLQAFLPGVALAWIEDPALDALARRPRLATWLPTALLVAAASIGAIHVTRSARFDALESITSSLVAGCLLAAALVREWTTGRSWKLLDHPVLRWLGVRSYGIFLYHWGLAVLLAPVVATIESPVARALALLLLVVPTAALAAAISWSLIEKPALGFRRRWRARGATT
jgi:peptidoglycan/LPS O-acetylase OafA/YrhL